MRGDRGRGCGSCARGRCEAAEGSDAGRRSSLVYLLLGRASRSFCLFDGRVVCLTRQRACFVGNEEVAFRRYEAAVYVKEAQATFRGPVLQEVNGECWHVKASEHSGVSAKVLIEKSLPSGARQGAGPYGRRQRSLGL